MDKVTKVVLTMPDGREIELAAVPRKVDVYGEGSPVVESMLFTFHCHLTIRGNPAVNFTTASECPHYQAALTIVGTGPFGVPIATSHEDYPTPDRIVEGS